MRILAASDIEPTCGKAHAINVVKTGGGFARLGHEVTLLCRCPETGACGAWCAREFGEPALRWAFAPVLTPAERVPGHERRAREFGELAVCVAREVGAELVYARHFEAALACARAGLDCVVETHAYIGDHRPILGELFASLGRGAGRVRGLVTISSRLAQHYVSRGADAGCVRVVPDGVDVEMFTPGREARAERGPRVVYTGHLYEHKGIPTIIEAARRLPGVRFDLVGGLPEDLERARRRAEGLGNVHLPGAVPYRDVPGVLWGASAALLVPSATEASCGWTSPVKLGEYLAAGVPVIASSIPALRDWLDEATAVWCAPDDPNSLAGAIQRTLALNRSAREARIAGGRRAAAGLAYSNRARQIVAAGASVMARAA